MSDQPRRTAFSLIEMMIAIVILGLGPLCEVPLVSGAEVVQDVNIISLLHEMVHQMAAQETRSSRDYHYRFHLILPSVISLYDYYIIVP